MKLIALVFSVMMTGAFAFANDIKSETLPNVSDVLVVVKHGPDLAAVQPYTTIVFKHISCAEQEFSAQTEKVNNVVYIRLTLDPDAVDCMGPVYIRDYKVQVSSDATGEQYVVLNPLEPIHTR